MKIGLVEITKMIEDCKKIGFDVRMSDIAYVILSESFSDKSIPYKILFDKNTSDKEIRAYNRNKNMKFLKKYIESNFMQGGDVVIDLGKKNADAFKEQYADMTFEENKDAMIKMIGELKEALDDGRLEYKDYAKMVTDLRTKLNDKFSVSEKQEDQRVIVYKKYNDICVCGREIYRPTRDDIIEDLKKAYDLVPKNKVEEEGSEDEREDEDED